MLIEKTSYIESERLKNESIFNCSSGKLGIRGCFEEGCPDNQISIRGAYINGFCENESIDYNEKLYGFPSSKQTIVNLPDAQSIEIVANSKKINCWSKESFNFNYCLNMQDGFVERSYLFDTGKGSIKVCFNRFTSFVRPGIFVIKATINSINYDGKITINSLLNGDVKNFTNSADPRVASGSGKMLTVNRTDISNDIQTIEVETINSKRKAVVSVINYIDGIKLNNQVNEKTISANTSFDISSGKEIVLYKYCYYYELLNRDETSTLIKAFEDGYDVLLNEQKEYMHSFWNDSRIEIESDDIKQEHLDYCLYEMLCAAGKDGKTSIAAKGLSGEGYEGHYFWDCEIYIYPFFLITNKEIAKSLLMYRYTKLDDAKNHARTLGHNNGALYPWRTITGTECSSYFPSGSAQYHINGDIARAFIQYFNVTNDIEFLPYICEVILETSRLWIDVGHFHNGKFKIDCVTGPDEYTCLVNNNYYTNAGAAYNLINTVRLINLLKTTKHYNSFINKTGVTEEELQTFLDAGNNMYYPYDEKLGIICQDDSFLYKKKVDLNSFSKDNFPLLLNYHPLYLYRHQICKQADAVLANYIFTKLDSLTSMRTFEYYDSITTHDSSLSKCIFGIMSARLGNIEKAKEYFIETLNTDLDDCKGNTKDGLHIANMGGCYRMILGGFAGLDIDENGIRLFPMLPKGFKKYSFNITYKEKKNKVVVDNTSVKLRILNSSDSLLINVYGDDVLVDNNEKEVSRKCKGVIFDLDGVITDTAIYHYQAWKMIADDLKVTFNEKLNEQFKGVSRKKCLELLLEWGNIKLSNKEFNELLEKKNKYYLELLDNLTPNSVLPGIKETLITLHNNNIKVALFSVSKNTDYILSKLNISDLFDAKVTGNDISNSKPHYEGYLLAADKLGLDPRLCVMVEDSAAGIIGAKSLSLKTIAIMKDNVANADYCFDTTLKLTDIINYL